MKELLLLAKSKGFQPRTFSTIWTFRSILGEGKNVLINEDCKNNLLSELQRWLREVHKIHLVCWWYDKNDKFYTELGRKNDNIIRVQTGDTTKLFNTYEEALEAGLQKALKLIK